MGGGVRSVSFSWDGSFVVGGSDEGLGIEIVSSVISSRLPSPVGGIDLTDSGRPTSKQANIYTPSPPRRPLPASHGIRSATGWHTLVTRRD